MRGLPFLLGGLGLTLAVVGVGAALREVSMEPESPGGRTRLSLAVLGVALTMGQLGASIAAPPEALPLGSGALSLPKGGGQQRV